MVAPDVLGFQRLDVLIGSIFPPVLQLKQAEQEAGNDGEEADTATRGDER